MSMRSPTDTYKRSVDPQVFMKKITFQHCAGTPAVGAVATTITPLMISPNSFGILTRTRGRDKRQFRGKKTPKKLKT